MAWKAANLIGVEDEDQFGSVWDGVRFGGKCLCVSGG